MQERESLEKQMEDLAVRMRQESDGALLQLRQDLEHEKVCFVVVSFRFFSSSVFASSYFIYVFLFVLPLLLTR
jgi:hypothetical protein